MKQKVLVITNFSEASQQALNYVCGLLELSRYHFLLAHIYTLPMAYTIEGVALASVGEAFQGIEERLSGELNRIKHQFPALDIEGQYILGGVVESSQKLIAAYGPQLLVFGTTGFYSALWHADSELLLALRKLSIPVMIIPQHIIAGKQ